MIFSGITLVTGAAGFMGSHLVEHLVQKGVRVRATSRPRADTRFFDHLGVEFIGADLTRPETLLPLFEGPVDRVFHLGAICNFSTPYEKLYPTNVAGVERLSDLALKAGVKCFVHVTSTSVYGRYRNKPFIETSRRIPADNYGRSKRDGEDIIFSQIEKGLPAIIVRPCTVYGPRCNDGAGKVFSRPTKLSAAPGDGKQRLSNIRAEDVAAAVLFLSQRDEALGEVFNMAEDTHPTVGEALSTAAEAFRIQPPKFHLPLFSIRLLARISGYSATLRGKIPDLEYDAACYLSDDYIVDNTKLKNTGFKLQFPDFRESMKQMGEWYWKKRT
jgi:nucleoside-diphosphate-sugar epimerase